MKVSGFNIGQVETIGELDSGPGVAQTVLSWMQLVIERSEPPGDLKQLENFFRTVHMDLWGYENMPDTDGDQTEFLEFGSRV